MLSQREENMNYGYRNNVKSFRFFVFRILKCIICLKFKLKKYVFFLKNVLK